MPTANEMLPAIGQTIHAKFEELVIECVVRDVKSSYGRVRMLVEPKCGSGSQWVEITRLVRSATSAQLSR